MNEVTKERKKSVGDVLIEAFFIVPSLIAVFSVVLWVVVPSNAINYVIAAALVLNAFYLQFSLELRPKSS